MLWLKPNELRATAAICDQFRIFGLLISLNCLFVFVNCNGRLNTGCRVLQCTLHYITFIEPQRSPQHGRQRQRQTRATQRRRDLETGEWRVADSALTLLLLTHKAKTGRSSASSPSRSHFIVEWLLLLPTLCLLSSVWSAVRSLCFCCVMACVFAQTQPLTLGCWANSKARPTPSIRLDAALINLHNAVTHSPRAPNTFFYFIYLCILYIALCICFIIYNVCNGTLFPYCLTKIKNPAEKKQLESQSTSSVVVIVIGLLLAQDKPKIPVSHYVSIWTNTDLYSNKAKKELIRISANAGFE